MMEQHIQIKMPDISIIIPIFNQKNEINNCILRILNEISASIQAEILLIDDGSTDGSDIVCKNLVEQYQQVHYFYQENAGVSAARNLGIRNAKGKYLFYLDADDELEKGTIAEIKDFFDSVEEEVDLVTYPIDTIYKGRILPPHFRYQFLKESGVYDLNEYPYIGQTTMNIVVKNKFEKNILFDEEQTFSEDQKYCCEVLKDKLKMGYCAKGRYLYYRSENSSSGKLSGSCYIFEQCTRFFEEMFGWYEEKVPVAFQGLFINDYYWKLCCNILLPYHYDGEEYKNAIQRLTNLLLRCSTEVILNHPQIDFFEKYYLLRMKNPKELECRVREGSFGLYYHDKCSVCENSIEIVLTKCQIRQKKLVIHGFLKSVFFQFYEEQPTLCAIENNGALTRKLALKPSVHNYYLSHESTQRFWAFTYEVDIEKVWRVAFEMEVQGVWFPVHYYFMPCVPFSHKYHRYTYTNNGTKITVDKNNQINIKTVKYRKSTSIWLYYDCAGVAKDNGMLQFLHDYEKQDGIQRYYIVSDKQQEQYLPNKKCAVEWGSSRHKKLFLKCEKIMTAFIEEENLIPFTKENYEKYSGRFRFEIVYLQHGVLHIEMPWKYSPERILADRVVVSTKQEAELFCRNGFKESDLLKCRMPRFQKKKEKQATNRILFAPSWRSYLVGNYVGHCWTKLKGKFLASAYYKQIQNFLKSKKLIDFLENNQYQLDIKLHPIFSIYEKYFETDSKSIHMIKEVHAPEDYEILITDISSYAYDYLFQGIPVFCFLPDWIEFKSGMNGYRNIGTKDYWETVIIESEDLVERLIQYVKEGYYEGLHADFYDNQLPSEIIYQEEIKQHD